MTAFPQKGLCVLHGDHQGRSWAPEWCDDVRESMETCFMVFLPLSQALDFCINGPRSHFGGDKAVTTILVDTNYKGH